MKVAVVLNQSAGSLMGVPIEEAMAQARTAFQAAGWNARVVATEGASCSATIREAVESDAEAVVVGGGDGTIATAANLVIPAGKILGILPLGTMNLLARDLGIPFDLHEAITALARGHIGAIDVGEVNGQIFLNNSVLGLYPAMVQERERQRGRHGLSKWPAMAVAAVVALVDFPLLRVRMDFGTGPVRVRTPILAVANNVYDEGYGPVLRRSSLDAGRLGIYLARHHDAWSLARLLTRLGLGTWHEDEDLDTLSATELVVRSRRRSLRVANDGEVLRMTPPLVYRIRPKALKVLLPEKVQP